MLKLLTLSSVLAAATAHGIVKRGFIFAFCLISANEESAEVIFDGVTYDGPYPNYGEEQEFKAQGPIRQVKNLDPITDIYSPDLAVSHRLRYIQPIDGSTSAAENLYRQNTQPKSGRELRLNLSGMVATKATHGHIMLDR